MNQMNPINQMNPMNQMNPNGMTPAMMNYYNQMMNQQQISSMGQGTPIEDLITEEDIPVYGGNQPTYQQMHQNYNHEYPNMEELALNLNQDLDEPLNKKKKNNNNNNNIKSKKKKELTLFSRARNYVQDPLLLIIVYVIMSQSFIISLISNYITVIKKDTNGKHSILGLFIYGTIITSIFYTTKNLIPK